MRRERTLGAVVLHIASGALVFAGALGAGELEPPGPPAPTMKSLDEVPPAWGQVLDSTDGDPDGCDSSRFRCVMGGAAVLDLETGLVWQRVVPSGAGAGWIAALDTCIRLELGGRRGWRLPKMEELLSLVDPFTLPVGHPFTVDIAQHYWSATTDWLDPSKAGIVGLATGGVFFPEKEVSWHWWCVRGGVPNVFTSQPNGLLLAPLGSRE